MAQLGERLPCTEEVVGSNPSSSTSSNPDHSGFFLFHLWGGFYMKKMRRFSSLLALLAFLAILSFAQSSSEASAAEGEKTASSWPAAFSEPLYCAGSGDNVDITFSASDSLPSSLVLDIYNFDLASALSQNVPVNYANLTSQDFQRLQFALKEKQTLSLAQVKVIPSGETEAGKAPWHLYSLSLPKLKDGLYLLRLYDSQTQGQESFQIISISNIRLASFHSGVASGVVWILDSQTGRPLSPDRIFYQTYTQNKKSTYLTLTCSSNGLVNLPSPLDKISSLCLVAKGEQKGVAIYSDSGHLSPRWKAFLWCDSRSAAPGQTLTYKAVLHDIFSGAALSEDTKEVFQVSLRSWRNETIVKSKAALGFSGTLSGVIKIPNNLSRQPYVLVLEDSRGAKVASCGLASALPDYADIKFKVEPSKPFFSVGQDVLLNLSLTDGEGLPITGREVTLSFSLCQVKAKVGHQVGSLGVEANSSFTSSSKLPALKTNTDLAGRAQVKFTCPPSISSEAQLAVVRVQASARGSQNRLYRSVCSFSVVSAPAFLSLEGPGEIRANSLAQYLVQASDFSGMPLKGLKLEVAALSESGESVDIGQLTTDSKGCSLLTWQPPAQGRYTVSVRAIGGAKLTSAHGENYDLTKLQARSCLSVLADDSDSFDIDIANHFINAGENCEIRLYAPKAVKKALLILDRDGILSRYLVTLTNGRAAITLPFKKKFAPAVRITALAYLNGDLKKAEELVYVHDLEQIFNIKASWVAPPLSGQVAGLDLVASDNRGKHLVSWLNVRLIGPEDQPYLAQDSIFRAFCSPDNGMGATSSWTTEEADKLADNLTDFIPVILYPENKCLEAAKVRTAPDGGAARCSLTMPNEEGHWKLLVTGLTEDGKIGQTVVPFILKKDIEASVLGPTAINRGDFAKYSVKLQNCTDQDLNFTVAVKAEDTSILLVQDNSSTFKIEEREKITLKARGSHTFDFMVKSGLPGASNIIVELKGDKGVERYSQPVEVLPLVTVYSQDANALLRREADLKLDSFRKDFIGRIFDRHLSVEIMNGAAGVLASSVHSLSNLSANSSEAVLATWASPVIGSAPFMKHNLKIPAYFSLSPEQAQDNLLSLQMAQNKDGGFSWRFGLASDPIYTSMIVRYLNALHETGVSEVEPLIKGSETYLQKVRSSLDLGERLILSLAFQNPKISSADLDKALHKAHKLDNPSFIALVRYLDLNNRRGEAKRLWQGAKQRYQAAKTLSFVSENGLGAETIFYPGSSRLSDCKTTALALITNLSLEGDSAKSQALLNWLLANRCGQAWNTPSDTLVALEAVSAYMYRFYKAPQEFSYGIWINGNELDSDNSLAEKNDWHRSFSLSVAQLPDSPLTIKVIKSGSDPLWVHIHESLTVHGLPEVGYRKEEPVSYTNSAAQAPFFISSEFKILEAPKDKVHSVGEALFGHLGEKAFINLKVRAKKDWRYAIIDLPYLGGWEVTQIEGLEQLNAHFDKQANRIYITFLPQGEHTFKLKGRLVYQGEFTAKPALLQFDNAPFECAQAAPFTLAVGE